MPNTARGYPYPTSADDADVPGDIQALASALDTDVAAVETALATDIGAVGSAYKEIASGAAFMQDAQFTTGGYQVLGLGSSRLSGGGNVTLGNNRVVHDLDPADYAVAGKTTKYRLVGRVVTDDVAPGVTFVFEMVPVTAGLFTNPTVTLGTPTPSSGASIVTPGANAISTRASSGDFTPPAAGPYVLTCWSSGAFAAGAVVHVVASLRERTV